MADERCEFRTGEKSDVSILSRSVGRRRRRLPIGRRRQQRTGVVSKHRGSHASAVAPRITKPRSVAGRGSERSTVPHLPVERRFTPADKQDTPFWGHE